MPITLSPELEKRIEERVKSGDAPSVEEFIRRAIQQALAEPLSTPFRRPLLSDFAAEQLRDIPQDALDRLPDYGSIRERLGREVVRRPAAEIFDDAGRDLPDSAWADMPEDAAEQHDHYLYGAPKKDE